MVVRIGEYEIRPFNGDRMEKADPTVTADLDRAIEPAGNVPPGWLLSHPSGQR